MYKLSKQQNVVRDSWISWALGHLECPEDSEYPLRCIDRLDCEILVAPTEATDF